MFFFFSSRRRHTRWNCDWSSDVCSSDLQLTCIFVDTGCLRAGEREQVVDTFSRHLHIPLVVVDAHERFLARLADVIDPEQKRMIIGEEFIRVFEEEATRQSNVGASAE